MLDPALIMRLQFHARNDIVARLLELYDRLEREGKHDPELYWLQEAEPAPIQIPFTFPEKTIWIAHLCPLAGDARWRTHLRFLNHYRPRFTAAAVAVAEGPGLEFVSDESLPGWTIFRLPNNNELRETLSFPVLLSWAFQQGQACVFYSHSKANSSADNRQGAWRWAMMMYDYLLERWPVAVLRDYPCCGTTKIIQGNNIIYPTRLHWGKWMFAGTFFWFRTDALHDRPYWRVAPDRYGAESWLSGLVPAHQAKSLYQPWPEEQYPTPSPYSPELYDAKYDSWQPWDE